MIKTKFTVIAVALMLFVIPVNVYADKTARYNNNFTNPNWQNMHDYDHWNWRHNWAYQAPQYDFETIFPVDQWARPTISNVAPQHTQNIRRDRHASFLPPSNGAVTEFYSGEFPTERVNPFAPRENNNPAASRAVAIEESVFALLPGESGVNVRTDGTNAGGFLASTGSFQFNGGDITPLNSIPLDTGDNSSAPWQVPVNQDGFTVNHIPIEQTQQTQTSNPQNRVRVVTPLFDDGIIGKITIPVLNNRVASVRPDLESSTLNNYVGHFSHTSQWDGGIVLASHNCGRGSFFAEIWTLQYGDRIFYETTMGVRIYEVISVEQISETDISNLDHSHENTLTLITCVYNRPEFRWSIRAREVV